jgi:phthiocerol/phenolphthiocerol synthesis type-I polyketide synthase E
MTQLLVPQTTVAGSDATQRQLARIWEELLDVESIAADQNYFDLGGDSSSGVQMFAQIEKVFKVKLPLATLYEAPTIEELARIVRGEVESSGWSPLVAIQPSGSRPPFFCFHGAGGNVLNYQKLSQHLGSDHPFYGLQSQGMDGTSPLLTTIEEMAALYVKQIRKVQTYGPYFLGGYCMGGTVAYEVAQQLRASGETVALLALFDTMNWHKIPLTFWSKSSYTCQQVIFHAANLIKSDGKIRFFHEKLQVLWSRIPVWRDMLLTAFDRRQDSSASTSRLLGKIWQTNDRACWKYIPEAYPGAILDFRPTKQYRVFNKPDLKWDRLAQGGQRVFVLPVYPAGMLVEPFVKHLAAALRASMDEAISAYPSTESKESLTQCW